MNKPWKLFKLALVIKGMRKRTKRNLFVAATYGAVLFLGLLLGQNYAEENQTTFRNSFLPLGLADKTGKVQRMLNLIASNYVDSVNTEELQNLAIAEIVAQLDPHSYYLDPGQARMQYETLEGSFEGIGIEYYKLNDTLMTVGLIADGPAQKAGMRVGDKLIAINGEPIAGVRITDKAIEEKIRGRRGTVIEIGINRAGTDMPLPLKVARDKIEVSSIDAAYIIDSVTGYIKIRRFGAKTAADFSNVLQNLKRRGAQRLILDLRENGGGYFSAATELTSQFFDDKQLIVYTHGAHEARTDYYSTSMGMFGAGKLAVLIDEHSASGSEIVAGAIQDLGRGVIVGRRSFGKGLVQEQFGFGDGSALNLTIARYYTPLGRSIQKSYAKTNGDSMRKLLASSQGGGFSQAADSSGNAPQAMFKTANGKTVYGGGGILPDVYVPADSVGAPVFYRKLLQHDLIENYVYERLTKSVPAYSVENFVTGYFLPDKEYEGFLEYVLEKGLSHTPAEAVAIKPMIQTNIEALLGRYYFGSEAYFKVRNRSDQAVDYALNALRSE